MRVPIAYLNGCYLPADEAVIAVTDAGFVQGVAVAEQLRTFGGELFRLDAHLDRLEQSLRIVGVELGMSRAELQQVALRLVAENHRLLAADDDLGLSIVVTPGAYPAYCGGESGKPTVCLHTYPLPFRLWAEKYRRGQAVRISTVQQVPPQCWPPALKCRSRMHYYLADRQAAAAEPGSRAVLLDADGFVTEASTANILLYRAGKGLLSPPLGKILRGVSLMATVELAEKLSIRTTYCDLTVDDVAAADEVFLTSTPVGILPVTQLNGRPIGGGEPGPVYRQLLAGWNRLAGFDIAQQARRFSRR